MIRTDYDQSTKRFVNSNIKYTVKLFCRIEVNQNFFVDVQDCAVDMEKTVVEKFSLWRQSMYDCKFCANKIFNTSTIQYKKNNLSSQFKFSKSTSTFDGGSDDGSPVLFVIKTCATKTFPHKVFAYLVYTSCWC